MFKDVKQLMDLVNEAAQAASSQAASSQAAGGEAGAPRRPEYADGRADAHATPRPNAPKQPRVRHGKHTSPPKTGAGAANPFGYPLQDGDPLSFNRSAQDRYDGGIIKRDADVRLFSPKTIGLLAVVLLVFAVAMEPATLARSSSVIGQVKDEIGALLGERHREDQAKTGEPTQEELTEKAQREQRALKKRLEEEKARLELERKRAQAQGEKAVVPLKDEFTGIASSQPVPLSANDNDPLYLQRRLEEAGRQKADKEQYSKLVALTPEEGKKLSAVYKKALNDVAVGYCVFHYSKSQMEAVLDANRTPADARTFALERVKPDYNLAALRWLQQLSAFTDASRKGYEDYLTSRAVGFTPEQARYALEHVQIDYGQNAAHFARYLHKRHPKASLEQLEEVLVSPKLGGFTPEEVDFALSQLRNATP